MRTEKAAATCTNCGGDVAGRSSPTLLLSPSAAARELDISRTRVYELMRSRELPAVTLGRGARIAYADLVEFVERLRANHDAR